MSDTGLPQAGTEQPTPNTLAAQVPTTGPTTDGVPQQDEQPTPNDLAAQANTEAPDQERQDTGQEPDPTLTKARREAASYRTKLREQEKANADLQAKFDAMLQGLGQLTGTTDTNTPEDALQAAIEERDAATARLNSMAEEQAITRAGLDTNADTNLLIPYLKGSGALNDLDPTADDYQAQVAEVVKATVEAHPQLRTSVVPNTSGNAPTPTQNKQTAITREQLEAMSPEEIYAAQKAGKLNHLFR